MRVPLRGSEAADLIGRFLEGNLSYPQEWNDFVDRGRRVEQQVEPYRDRCDQLDPLVNRPGLPDPEALAELRRIVTVLRTI